MPRLTASAARPTARASGGPRPPKRHPPRRGPPRRPPALSPAAPGPRTPLVARPESRPPGRRPSRPRPFTRPPPASPISAPPPRRRPPRGRRRRPTSRRRAAQRRLPRPAAARPRRREHRTGPPREARRTGALPLGPPSTRPLPDDLVRASPGRAPEAAPPDRPRHRRRVRPRPVGRPPAPAAVRLLRLTAAVARRSARAPVVPSPRRPEGLLDRPPADRSRRLQGWADGARPPGLGLRPAPAVPEEEAGPPVPAPGALVDTGARGPEATGAVAPEVGWDAVPCRRPRLDEVVRAAAGGLPSVDLAVAGATWRSSSPPS